MILMLDKKSLEISRCGKDTTIRVEDADTVIIIHLDEMERKALKGAL